jgi:hypothetical protein
MWKPGHRRAANRHGLRYPSDLSDREWALIEPSIPPAKRGGRRCEVNVREVLNAIFYVLSTDRLPVAGVAEGPATEKHRALLLYAVGLGRHPGAHPSRALCRDPRARRARGELDGRDHRQPECQSQSKRGSALDPQGFDAGKVTGASAISLSIHSAFCRTSSFIPAIFRTATGRGWFSIGAPGASSPSSSASSPMPAIRAHAPRKPLPAPTVGCSRSSSATNCTNSLSCPSAGSSNQPWPGSAAIAAWHVTSSDTRAPLPPSSGSP